jgi:hypothetical protein
VLRETFTALNAYIRQEEANIQWSNFQA